jgi:hypothetical protein
MRRVVKLFLTMLVAPMACKLIAGDSVLLARAPNDQQKYNEVVRSAQQFELLGYILGGAGILLAAASIPLAIYWDRKKKARERAAQRAPDVGRSGPGRSQR